MYFEISPVVIIFRRVGRQAGRCTCVEAGPRGQTYFRKGTPSSDVRVSQGVGACVLRVHTRTRARTLPAANAETSCRCGRTVETPVVWSVREHKGSREINSLAQRHVHARAHTHTRTHVRTRRPVARWRELGPLCTRTHETEGTGPV